MCIFLLAELGPKEKPTFLGVQVGGAGPERGAVPLAAAHGRPKALSAGTPPDL